MSGYLLILTLTFKYANAGMGGIESIKVDSLYDCNRIGRAWVEKLVDNKRFIDKSEALYQCIKL